MEAFAYLGRCQQSKTNQQTKTTTATVGEDNLVCQLQQVAWTKDIDVNHMRPCVIWHIGLLQIAQTEEWHLMTPGAHRKRAWLKGLVSSTRVALYLSFHFHSAFFSKRQALQHLLLWASWPHSLFYGLCLLEFTSRCWVVRLLAGSVDAMTKNWCPPDSTNALWPLVQRTGNLEYQTQRSLTVEKEPVFITSVAMWGPLCTSVESLWWIIFSTCLLACSQSTQQNYCGIYELHSHAF